jgi:hypothetical protein
MLAVDFFRTDCAVTLKRIYMLFALEVNSRYVHPWPDHEPTRAMDHCAGPSSSDGSW